MTFTSYKSLLAIVVALFACDVAAAQTKRVDLTTGAIGISLIVPSDFEQFTDEQMALVKEKGVPAKFVFQDLKTDALIVINTLGNDASPAGLSKVEAEIKSSARKQQPLVESLGRAFIRINGRKWLRFSIKEGSEKTASISTYLITDWAGQYVLVNFSAPASKYEKFKRLFRKSAASVQLELIAQAFK